MLFACMCAWQASWRVVVHDVVVVEVAVCDLKVPGHRERARTHWCTVAVDAAARQTGRAIVQLHTSRGATFVVEHVAVGERGCRKVEIEPRSAAVTRGDVREDLTARECRVGEVFDVHAPAVSRAVAEDPRVDRHKLGRRAGAILHE